MWQFSGNFLSLRDGKIAAYFSTRLGGTSPPPYAGLNLGFHVGDDPEGVRANRREAGRVIGFPPEDWVVAQQVHGVGVAMVGEEDRGKGSLSLSSAVPEVDGLVTAVTNLPLVGFFADCAALFFWDEDGRAVGLAHAGWRGTAGGIGIRMVEAFRSTYGVVPGQIRAAIGPTIGKCCYRVGEEVAQRFPQEAIIDSPRGLLLDLAGANRRQLEEVGVTQIQVAEFCPSCRKDLFFSHRGEKGHTGRMGGFIVRKA